MSAQTEPAGAVAGEEHPVAVRRERRDGLRDAELIVGPRFTGAPQAALTVARCETQMSLPPEPPGRVEWK